MENDYDLKKCSIIREIHKSLTEDNDPAAVAIISNQPEDRRMIIEAACVNVINQSALIDDKSCPSIVFFENVRHSTEFKEKMNHFYGLNSIIFDNLHHYSFDDDSLHNIEIVAMDRLSKYNYEYIFFDIGTNLYQDENNEFLSNELYDLEYLRGSSKAKVVFTAGYDVFPGKEKEMNEPIVLKDKTIEAFVLD